VKHRTHFPAESRTSIPRSVFHVKQFSDFALEDEDQGLQFCNWEKCFTWNIFRFGMSHNEIAIYYLPLSAQLERASPNIILQRQLFSGIVAHFTHVYQSITLAYVIVGLVSVGAISRWSGSLGGGFGRLLLAGLGWRWGP
jgi:hypothetical protein